MIKNTASQKIGAQMISAVDGSAFTGTVTVYVTGDAGTQAIGTVSSGVCTHEGNGYHTYAPSQAETNYDLIAFTFIGTGAVPQTIQLETRLTTPVANVTQWLGTAVNTPTVAGVPNVNTKTWNDLATVALPLIPTVAGRTLDVSAAGEAGVDLANVGSSTTTLALSGTTVGTVTTLTNAPADSAGVTSLLTSVATLLARLGAFTGTGVNTVLGFFKAALSKTASTPSDIGGTFDPAQASTQAIRDQGDAAWGGGSGGGGGLDAAGVRSALGMASNNLDTQLGAIAAYVDTEVSAIKAKTDNLPEGVKRNTALSNFEFFMADSSDHVTAKTGLTVAVAASIDGAAFAAVANTPATEVGNGIYKINLAAADLNGTIVTLRCSASGADASLITIKTNA